MHRLLPLLFCFAGPFLYAQYGALDPTFGDGGLVTFPSGMGHDLVIQSDGKILVTGNVFDSLDHLALTPAGPQVIIATKPAGPQVTRNAKPQNQCACARLFSASCILSASAMPTKAK